MAKTNPLTQGLSKQNHQTEGGQVNTGNATKPSSTRLPPSRVGRVLIGGHFAPEVQTELKVLAAQERTSVQALIAEGINAVFARRHKSQIARLTPQQGSGER